MSTHENSVKLKEKIIKCTDDLLYEKGFNLMSFTDIADAANVPRGNIYYHFKTKDEVLEAVIEYRINGMKKMLDEWDKNFRTPLERLKCFAQIPINEKKRVMEYGCPMGTLNSELGKTQEPLQVIAKKQMDVFRSWLVDQFKALCPNRNADHLTEQILIRTQGMSTLTHIYKDESIISREVENIEAWLDSLAPS